MNLHPSIFLSFLFFSSASPLILPHFHPHILPFFPSIHLSTGPYITTLPPTIITSIHYPTVPSLPPSVHPYTSTQPYALTYFQSTESRVPLFLFSFASIYRSIHRMHFILYSFQFLVSTYVSLRRLLHTKTYCFPLPSTHPHSLLIHF